MNAMSRKGTVAQGTRPAAEVAAGAAASKPKRGGRFALMLALPVVLA